MVFAMFKDLLLFSMSFHVVPFSLCVVFVFKMGFGRFSISHGTSAMEMLNLPNHPPLRTRSVRKV